MVDVSVLSSVLKKESAANLFRLSGFFLDTPKPFKYI